MSVRQQLRQTFDTQGYGVVLAVLLTVAVCLQILILVVTVFSFIPIKLDSSDQILPQVAALFRPEREIMFYQVFVVLTVVIHIAVMTLFKDRLRDEIFLQKLKHFLIAEYIWVGLLVFAAFKILVYKEPFWAKAMFFTFLALSIVSKVFWIEVRSILRKAGAWLAGFNGDSRAVYAVEILFIVALGFLLWIPDLHAALGRILWHDRFNFLDQLLSPALASVSGARLNVDVFSPFGVIAPWVVGQLAQTGGVFQYEHAVGVLVILSIVYCAAGYGLLRTLWGSAGLAVFGILLFVKLHFFHVSALPLIWEFPQYTVLKFLFDLPMFYFLWKHSQDRRMVHIVIAALLCGLSLAYMPDTGLYQTLALYGYLAAAALLTPAGERMFVFPRDLRRILLCGLAPWIIAFGVLLVICQGAVFSAAFWANTHEAFHILTGGLGTAPVDSGLRSRQFFALIAGLGIPVLFVLTAFAVGFAVYLRDAAARHVWILAVCFHGLGLHWHYINRSEASVYYAGAMPLVVVICFWVNAVLRTWARDVRCRRLVLIILVFLTLGGLLTNAAFISYPNPLNLSRHDWSAETKFFAQEAPVNVDRGLIENFAPRGEAVPLIASFATRTLAEISRRPFFFYSPVMTSSLFASKEFRGTTLFSKTRMDKTLAQLEAVRPAYVFIEKRIYALAVPPEYEDFTQSWLKLKNYLTQKYYPVNEGQYLQVLKRKP